MKWIWNLVTIALVTTLYLGCSGSESTGREEQVAPSFFIRPAEPIAIMPFETENALSNLGTQLSDEVIVNLLEHTPTTKIIPATVVRTFLQNNTISPAGFPDAHTVHGISQGLKCKYLLTGNLYTSFGDVKYTPTYTNRVATGSVTVRLVDCDSNMIVWAAREEASTLTTTYYAGGQPSSVYQTDGQLLQDLIKKLGLQVARNFYQHKKED
jgi:TolB-like protein